MVPALVDGKRERVAFGRDESWLGNRIIVIKWVGHYYRTGIVVGRACWPPSAFSGCTTAGREKDTYIFRWKASPTSTALTPPKSRLSPFCESAQAF